MTPFRIALAGLPFPESPEIAVQRATAAIAEASRIEARIICFPECYIPGYRLGARTVPSPDPEFLEHSMTTVAEAAAEGQIAVIMGTERFVGGHLVITTRAIGPEGELLGHQDKVQLDPSEEPMYRPGTERHLFEVGPLTFGVVICHEGWRYPETVRWAARRGAQIVFHPHFHEAEEGAYRPVEFADPKNTFHEKAMLCRAAENTCWFASVNCAEPGAATTSAIVRPDGTLLAAQPYGQEGLLVEDIDLDTATGLLASRCRTFA